MIPGRPGADELELAICCVRGGRNELELAILRSDEELPNINADELEEPI